MIYKIILKFSLLLFVACASCSENQNDTVLSSNFFTPTKGVEKVHIVGTVVYVGVSDYEKSECPSGKICLHLPAWQIYEIEGYILPEKDETENVRIAHRYGAALNSDSPWFATLERIPNSKLRQKIGADYLLVGVELGYKVFCPSGNSKENFKEWKSDFTNENIKNHCFSL